jgi:hypothetical protein
MTRDEIIAKWNGMTPRERDAWVEEVVFGAKIVSVADDDYYHVVLQSPGGIAVYSPVPRYTKDISAAWAVFERFPYVEFARIPGASVTYGVRVNDPDDGSVRAMTQADVAPEAIGLAAIIAKLAEEEG